MPDDRHANLQYAPAPTSAATPELKSVFWAAIAGAIVGALVGTVALTSALLMAFGRTGDNWGPVVGAGLFPWPMLVTSIVTPRPLLWRLSLCVAQYPVYGVIVGIAAEWRRGRLALILLAAAHAVATAASIILGYAR